VHQKKKLKKKRRSKKPKKSKSRIQMFLLIWISQMLKLLHIQQKLT